MKDDLIKMWFIQLKIKNEEKLCVLQSGISIYEFYEMKLKDYVYSGFNYITAENIQKDKDIEKYIQYKKYIDEEKIRIILYNDTDYPIMLKNIQNPPSAFFMKGTWPENSLLIAVVGARRASEYGKTAAYKFARELASRGITVVSGLARGIDTSAHVGAIDGKGRTIAVIGSGFKKMYPSCNCSLANDISRNGCIITEYMPDTDPFAWNFPERNRIISGLSKAVLVVEAGDRSGSLITARLALEQGRDVYAVPGNIFSPNSIGTNKLIRDGAKPVTDIIDILEEYNIDCSSRQLPILDKIENDIYCIVKSGAASIDDIITRTDVPAEAVLSALCKLECGGYIKKAYGGYYIAC